MSRLATGKFRNLRRKTLGKSSMEIDGRNMIVNFRPQIHKYMLITNIPKSKSRKHLEFACKHISLLNLNLCQLPAATI